ncbi:hypothetical protein Tco_0761798 [Tanacetum coccineum]
MSNTNNNNNNNNNMQTQTSSALHNVILEASGKDRPLMLAPDGTNEGNQTPPDKVKENRATILDEIRQKGAEAEVVQIILTGIDNDIYSTVDACPNAMKMWISIKRLKQGESINVQDLETSLFWEFGKITSQDGETFDSYYSRMVENEVNEIRAERLERTANPLALVAQHQSVYQPQANPINYKPEVVDDDEASLKEKEIDKLMALISMSFKKIYHPTNNNLKTSSNTRNINIDNTPRTNKGSGYDRQTGKYDNQRAVNVAGARENVADWRDDSDDEPEDQELEAHYMYMAKVQEVIQQNADISGPIFDTEPFEKVHTANDNYNVFANERQHSEQQKSINDIYVMEQDDRHISSYSSNICSGEGEADHDDD